MMALPHRSARALILLLCAIVLFAQQAALTHVVWHAAAQSTHEGNAGASEPDRAPARELASLCAFDAAFAQVLGGGAHGSDPGFTQTAITQVVPYRSRGFVGFEAPTPRSRGPPLIL